MSTHHLTMDTGRDENPSPHHGNRLRCAPIISPWRQAERSNHHLTMETGWDEHPPSHHGDRLRWEPIISPWRQASIGTHHLAMEIGQNEHWSSWHESSLNESRISPNILRWRQHKKPKPQDHVHLYIHSSITTSHLAPILAGNVIGQQQGLPQCPSSLMHWKWLHMWFNSTYTK